jgi:hypothetical protein
MLEAALGPLLLRNPKWREPPPVVPSDGVHCGGLPPQVRRFADERIRELIAILQGFLDDPKELNRAWHRMVMRDSFAGTLPPRAAADARPVSRDDRFRVADPGASAYGLGAGPSGEPVVFVYGANPPCELGYSLNTEPFFRQMFGRAEFTAGESVRWGGGEAGYKWEAVKALIEDLLSHGVIERLD